LRPETDAVAEVRNGDRHARAPTRCGPRSRLRSPSSWDVKLLVSAFDDLAALFLALFGRRLDDALALAGVLPGARVSGAGAAALALAGVDAGAAHLVPGGLVLGARGDGPGEKQRGSRARDQHTLALLGHDPV